MCILEFIQGARTNLVGVFESSSNAVEFLKSIPFLKEVKDEFGISYIMKYEDMPDSYVVTYKGWQYVLSRFSYSSYDFHGEIEAVLIDVCNLDKSPNKTSFVQGCTIVDAYSHDNNEVLEVIEKREAFYREAEQYYKTHGRKIQRDGLGSEDGEYVMVSAPNKPSEMLISFNLDPQTIEKWEQAGSFENWLAQNPHI